jgi:hypothetical protein
MLPSNDNRLSLWNRRIRIGLSFPQLLALLRGGGSYRGTDFVPPRLILWHSWQLRLPGRKLRRVAVTCTAGEQGNHDRRRIPDTTTSRRRVIDGKRPVNRCDH